MQTDHDTRDTYNRAWRTGGAPHARWTLQKKSKEVGEEDEEEEEEASGEPVLPHLLPAPYKLQTGESLLMSRQHHLVDAKTAFHSVHSVIQQTFIEQLLCARALAQRLETSP